MPRRVDYRRAKTLRSYTVEELADLFDVHKGTVRSWIKAGLTPIDDGRPLILLGADVRQFLKERRERGKRPCRPGELYCLPCREPRRPAGDMIECLPINATTGNLRGICPVCDRLMHRRASLDRVRAIAADLDVSFAEVEPTLEGTSSPPVNLDLEQARSMP